MPRRRRCLEQGQVYHIIQRGNNRGAMFRSRSDYETFYVCAFHAARVNAVAVHGFAFLDNHIHLMVTPSSDEGLSVMMQDVGRRYVPYFNRCHGRAGGLWEGRFKAFFVDTDRYFFECLRYIDLNPVRAGIVTTAEEYEWCSYHTNACGVADPLITPHPLYDDLGSCAAARQERYRSLCSEAVDRDHLEGIRQVLNSRALLA